MFQPKTHFEQIPLETVRKIVEKQVRRGEAAEALLRKCLQDVARDADGQSGRPVA
jgi:hypothetical protein